MTSANKSRGRSPSRGVNAAESATEILRRRAAQLARPLETLVDRTGDVEYVVFTAGAERYAIETGFVREVLALPELTPLPGAARVFVGVTSLRGEIVPIASFERLFGGLVGAAPNAAYLVLLGEDRAEVGVLATAMDEVTTIHPGALTAGGRERKLTRGVTREGLVVLDGRALLEDPRLSIEDESTEG